MRHRLTTSLGRLSILAGLAGLTACTRDSVRELPAATPIEVPAGAGAALPHVSEAGDDAILSWVEPTAVGHVLRFARWDGSAWTGARAVAEGAGWFVNWADFPSVVALEGDRLAAHWLQRSGASTYAYDVMVSRSSDGGATWSPPVRPHADGTPTEHGFVSLFPMDTGLGVIWLDGRKFVDGESAQATNEMALRFTTLDDAAASPELVLDERVCDCCQTAVALTTRGPVVAYRDRSPGEVRDISVTRLAAGEWTAPRTLHPDNWVIDACPVNGPQADAIGDDVAIAWFTAVNDTPRVHVAFSGDAGETFGTPVRIDGGNPLGRVDVLLLEGGSALVLWLERTGDGAEVMARAVTADGRAGRAAAVAQTLAQRPSGFPRMGRYAGGVLLAWTEPGTSSRVRAAVIELAAR